MISLEIYDYYYRHDNPLSPSTGENALFRLLRHTKQYYEYAPERLTRDDRPSWRLWYATIMNPNSDPRKNFTVPISSAHNVNIVIYVLQLRAQGLDLTPWPSTLVLASQLHKLGIDAPKMNSPNIPILELGAGIGLVGLTASIIWSRHAVLTDLEGVVAGLDHNIVLNQSLLHKHAGSATAGILDWENPDSLVLFGNNPRQISSTGKADIILAADTIYDDNHPEMLATTILQWLAPGPESRFILTCPLRVAYLDQIRELWQRLENGGLQALQEGKEVVEGDDWDDEKLCEWSVWGWKA